MPIDRHREEDCSLLERIQQGDELAIALLYDSYSSVIYSIALRVLRDPTLAEQVLVDIFAEVWRSPECFLQIVGDFSFWLITIARDRAVAKLLNKPVPDFDFASPDEYVNRQEWTMTRETACEAIEKIPVERRIMLEKAFFREKPASAFLSPAIFPLETEHHMVMVEAVSQLADTGLEVIDLLSDATFARRKLHVHDSLSHIEAMNRLARIFITSPTTLLQELVTAAVDLCGADSAGISIEQKDSTDDNFYHWVATAGQYSGFADAKLPRFPSACGVTLERGRPQIFRVAKKFFELMGIEAPIVTDGMLLPWQVEETRGTIWIMAHGRTEAFDGEDCRMMQALSDFAATGVRLHQQQSW